MVCGSGTAGGQQWQQVQPQRLRRSLDLGRAAHSHGTGSLQSAVDEAIDKLKELKIELERKQKVGLSSAPHRLCIWELL